MTRRRSVLSLILRLGLLLGVALPTAGLSARPAAGAPQQQETMHDIFLEVVSARTEPRHPDGHVLAGDPVPSYEYQIVVDNTGSPFPLDDELCFAETNPDYPEGCEWPGVRTNPGWAPIYTQGDQDDLNETTGISLPAGKYLISVLADGYKVDGEHLTLPDDAGLVQVAVHPHPLPPSTIVIKVFDDSSLTNGQFDTPENGLAGFRASVNDIAGEITADLFGNPLCTEYEKDAIGDVLVDEDGMPLNIIKMGGECLSDETGTITIPNLGTLRFDVLVTPPDGQQWIQTTTLEGSQGWDTWLQEAGTGLDNEFIVAAEPFPWTIFGFVEPRTPNLGSTGSIEGVIMGITTYSPSAGGLPHVGQIWGGLMGAKIERPIANPWLALNDLQNGDQAVWVGQGNPDGSFTIPNVPPGDYFLTYWDEKQHYILDFVQLTVNEGQTTDIGVRTMTSWFTEWYGTVFLDENENGKQDPGEPGVPDYVVVLRDRDNTEIDRMSVMAVTDPNGFYELEKGYPMTSWMVLEAYSDLFRTTGITYQASNQPEETTVLGPIVDVAVLPILSQRGRLDWGVKPYDPGTNGGIAGSVFYDTVRAEDEARYAGAEPWQPGIPDLEMQLYATVRDDVTGELLTDTVPGPNFGAYLKGDLLYTAVTENFVRPKNCVARDVNGDPVDFPSLPPSTGDYDCLEAPLMGVQFGGGQAELPGNWGFGEGCFDADPQDGVGGYDPVAGTCAADAQLLDQLPVDDYLVEVVIPDDPVTAEPLYQVTREEDLNMFDGDVFYPLIPPPACAGPLHVVDVADSGTDNYPLPWDPDQTSTPVVNPNMAAEFPSRFEGQPMPLCNVKLVNVADRKSVAPIFTLWTKVPIPGRWRGYIIDDLNVSSNPLELTFGEKAGLPNLPIGVYDYTGRLVHTLTSDFHGVYEVLLPSAATYNTPTPSGMNASVYYIYGNDPGQAGSFNANYNPQYRSIGTSFEIYPGVIVPSDLAPTQNGALIWAPGSQQNQLARCEVEPERPQLFAVDKPYALANEAGFTIYGLGFGTAGQVTLTLDDTATDLTVSAWSDTVIQTTLSSADKGKRVDPGAYQLSVRNGTSGLSTINGLTFHVLGKGYEPAVYEVGPGKDYSTIQSALDAAAGYADPDNAIPADPALVVVYPGVATDFVNPLGIWLENPIIYAPVKMQGVGPGGVYGDGANVPGSILDGRGMGGTEEYAGWWRGHMGQIWLNRGGWDGSPVDGDGMPRIYEGPVVTVLAEDGEFARESDKKVDFAASIDGFAIQGGDQQGMPNNFDQLGQPVPGIAPEIVVQGGGIFVNGYARFLRITNNVIQGNGGAYAGAIRIGTPDVPEPLKDHQNDYVVVRHNRILANGGTNLAGSVGVFAGAANYEIAHNDVCGNTSAEYGGGISHYGYSPGGAIHHNRIVFNRSYDEGGGIMIAGELPADPNVLSPGAGAVSVHENLIQGNLANDDGGGLRFLMAGVEAFDVYNNIVANNVSTHEGGGISLNDAPYVNIFNNTIVKNLTTATAMTSNGLPAPAGLSSSRNSALLQAVLHRNDPIFSDPVLFNNIFWDNRAGTWIGGGVAGIGQEGDATPIYHWDLGVAGGAGMLSPKSCLMQVPNGVWDDSNVVGEDPFFVAEYDLGVKVFPWRGNPNFIGADIAAVDEPVPMGQMGNYHLSTSLSPAVDLGTNAESGVSAPKDDFDGEQRAGRPDAGADEFSGTGVLAAREAVGLQVYLPVLIVKALSG